MEVLNEDVEAALPIAPVRRRSSRSRTLTEIRSVARSHTRTAIAVLVGVMRSENATPAARVSAASAILDRGWGKVAQPANNGEDAALQLIHRIEPIIVHPESSSQGKS